MFDPSRRKFRRVNVIGTGEIQKDPGSPSNEVFLNNIGYGGVAVYSKAWLNLEEQIELSLYWKDRENKEVTEKMRGEIIWHSKTGSLYVLGIQFQDLNTREHKLTIYTIDNLLKW